MRIFLVPLLVVVILTRYSNVLALTIFLIAALTDLLDGYIARFLGQITTLGKLLDPLADKLLISAALISLVEIGRAPAWMVVVIVGRELAVTGLRGIAGAESIVIPAERLGKYKTVSQILSICALILGPQNMGPQVGAVSLWIATILTIWSGVDYYVKFWNRLKV
jgi:CDP-diacylglycerol--glycerol-3-phosphate 3-phosphatidyltransferase